MGIEPIHHVAMAPQEYQHYSYVIRESSNTFMLRVPPALRARAQVTLPS